MSHPRHIELLAHYQPPDSHIFTPLPADVADLLVQRMVCERISQRRIRMLPPDSVFAVIQFCPEARKYIPSRMPPAATDGAYFKPPTSALESTSTVPRMRPLWRFREVFGDWQTQISLLPEALA